MCCFFICVHWFDRLFSAYARSTWCQSTKLTWSPPCCSLAGHSLSLHLEVRWWKSGFGDYLVGWWPLHPPWEPMQSHPLSPLQTHTLHYNTFQSHHRSVLAHPHLLLSGHSKAIQSFAPGRRHHLDVFLFHLGMGVTSSTVTKTLQTHLGCRASAGEAGSAVQWGDTGWSPCHSRGSQPTTALWDVSMDANERAQRVRESCSSSGRAHTETDSQPEERETRCCWHYRERESKGRTFIGHLKWFSASVTGSYQC